MKHQVDFLELLQIDYEKYPVIAVVGGGGLYPSACQTDQYGPNIGVDEDKGRQQTRHKDEACDQKTRSLFQDASSPRFYNMKYVQNLCGAQPGIPLTK